MNVKVFNIRQAACVIAMTTLRPKQVVDVVNAVWRSHMLTLVRDGIADGFRLEVLFAIITPATHDFVGFQKLIHLTLIGFDKFNQGGAVLTADHFRHCVQDDFGLHRDRPIKITLFVFLIQVLGLDVF